MIDLRTRPTPWWAGTPCPDCVPGCSESHVLNGREEWADGGAHFCRRVLAHNDDYSVELTRWAGVGAEPGSEVLIHDIQVYWHLASGDGTDMSPQDARRIVGSLWTSVLAAGQIADTLNAEAKA